MKQKGFTLVEFMVVTTVMLILAVFGVPNYLNMVGKSVSTGAADQLMIFLQSAKIEAIRERKNIVVCASINKTSCGSRWDNAIMFVDTNKNNAIDSGESIKKIISFDGGGGLQIKTVDSGLFSYTSLGVLKTGTPEDQVAAEFCSTLNPEQSRRVVVGFSEITINKVKNSACTR